MFQKRPDEMTYSQITARLEEIKIEFKSYEGADEYDLSELQEEKDDLENVLTNGDYLDFEEE